MDGDRQVKLREFEGKKVCLLLSGGADSALLLDMMCRHGYEINLLTGVEEARPTNEWHAREIVLYFKEKYPDVKWGYHEFFYYPGHRIDKRDKKEVHKAKFKEMYKAGQFDVLFNARTMNSKEVPGCDEKHRYTKQPEMTGYMYRPFVGVTKKWVAAEYHKHGLMGELYEMTASCTAQKEESDFWSKPCKECWWCKEKFWAFGSYDGGIT